MQIVELPKWLDKYIYEDLEAYYEQTCSNMLVIDYKHKELLGYLGTYFPRTYAEAYCICSDFLKEYQEYYAQQEELSVFDFGGGTGGEMIALLTTLNELRPNIKKVNIHFLEGNNDAIRIFERILNKFKKQVKIEVYFNPIPDRIEDFYDLEVLSEIFRNRTFDLFISFKSICEFVGYKVLEDRNPYQHIIDFILPHLNHNAVMFLADITCKIEDKWLAELLDKGVSTSQGKQIKQNAGYNQTYLLSHSRKQCDESKIAWRIITK